MFFSQCRKNFFQKTALSEAPIFKFSKMHQSFQKFQISSHKIKLYFLFVIHLIYIQLAYAPKLSSNGHQYYDNTHIDLPGILQDIPIFISPTQHSRTKYMKELQVCQFVSTNLKFFNLQSVFKDQDFYFGKKTWMSFITRNGNNKSNLDMLSKRLSVHTTQTRSKQQLQVLRSGQTNKLNIITRKSKLTSTIMSLTPCSPTQISLNGYVESTFSTQQANFALKLLTQSQKDKISQYYTFKENEPQVALMHPLVYKDNNTSDSKSSNMTKVYLTCYYLIICCVLLCLRMNS